MKASELVKVLEQVIAEEGDRDIVINVRDSYTKHGFDATIMKTMSIGLNHRPGCNTTTITACLNKEKEFSTNEVKYPKVSFRKLYNR